MVYLRGVALTAQAPLPLIPKIEQKKEHKSVLKVLKRFYVLFVVVYVLYSQICFKLKHI